MSIRTKLSAAFGAAFLLLVALGLFSLTQLAAVNGVTGELRDVWLPKLETISVIKRSLTAQNLLASRRTQVVNFRELAAASKTMKGLAQDIESEYERLENGIASEAELALLHAFEQKRLAYDESYSAVVDRIDSGEVSAGLQQFQEETVPAFNATMESLDRLEAFVDAGAEAAEEAAQLVYNRAQLLTLAAIALSGIAALGFILWASASVVAPLLRVSEAMRRLTAGDEGVEISDPDKRHDEIGTLLKAAAGYRESVRSARHLMALAEMERLRLSAAISNMPIGLCMFDDNNGLIVCNQKFSEIYDLPESVTRPGTAYEDIIAARVAAGTYTGSDPEAYKEGLLRSVAARQPKAAIWELNNGRAISTILQPMVGGWLATHEDITERRSSEAKIRHMARHDALTDLPNRVLFRDRLGEALEVLARDEAVAVLCLDLDRFKNVNDTLGHPIGDALLRAVADRLRAAVREGDTVARFGGDEFAVIQTDRNQPNAAHALAQRLIDHLSEPFDIDGHQISIGASVGIALAPNDGPSAEQVLKSADMALYRAKGDGRGIYRFFEAEMDAKMQARRRLELDLRRALAENEFHIHYQPVVSIGTGRIVTFEALLRWYHPTRGKVSPAEFIPLAEEIGLIVPIGQRVLRQACLDAMSWPEHIRVAVNLSPVQFRSKGLAEAVMTALAVSQLPAKRLELEITEGVLLADTEETIATLHRLRALGVHIAMDDFGTGYSSLSYLQSFPFDKIKIDASFVRRMSNDESSAAIVRAITSLSASLGMVTTAEGVETVAQLDQVREEGCTEVQGFLFSEARPAEELAELMTRLLEQSAA